MESDYSQETDLIVLETFRFYTEIEETLIKIKCKNTQQINRQEICAENK